VSVSWESLVFVVLLERSVPQGEDEAWGHGKV